MILCLIPPQKFDAAIESRSRHSYVMDFHWIFSEEEYKTKTVVDYIKR